MLIRRLVIVILTMVPREIPTSVFWGDTHVHTHLSRDAFVMGILFADGADLAGQILPFCSNICVTSRRIDSLRGAASGGKGDANSDASLKINSIRDVSSQSTTP